MKKKTLQTKLKTSEKNNNVKIAAKPGKKKLSITMEKKSGMSTGINAKQFVGWALRETGKKDRQKLLSFLDKHAVTMPRVTLRYAIEHFDRKNYDYYLNMKKVAV